jgi:hypothetical protein
LIFVAGLTAAVCAEELLTTIKQIKIISKIEITILNLFLKFILTPLQK